MLVMVHARLMWMQKASYLLGLNRVASATSQPARIVAVAGETQRPIYDPATAFVPSS